MGEKLGQSENFWQAQKLYQEAIDKHPKIADFYYHYILTSILCNDQESALSMLLYLSIPDNDEVSKMVLDENKFNIFVQEYCDKFEKISLGSIYKEKIYSFVDKTS